MSHIREVPREGILKELLQTVDQVQNGVRPDKQFVSIYGINGLGKTHVLQQAVELVYENFPEAVTINILGEHFHGFMRSLPPDVNSAHAFQYEMLKTITTQAQGRVQGLPSLPDTIEEYDSNTYRNTPNETAQALAVASRGTPVVIFTDDRDMIGDTIWFDRYFTARLIQPDANALFVNTHASSPRLWLGSYAQSTMDNIALQPLDTQKIAEEYGVATDQAELYHTVTNGIPILIDELHRNHEGLKEQLPKYVKKAADTLASQYPFIALNPRIRRVIDALSGLTNFTAGTIIEESRRAIIETGGEDMGVVRAEIPPTQVNEVVRIFTNNIGFIRYDESSRTCKIDPVVGQLFSRSTNLNE